MEPLAGLFSPVVEAPGTDKLPAGWWGERFRAEGDAIPRSATCRDREAEWLCRMGEWSLARGQLDMAYLYFAVIRHRYNATASVAHAAARSRERLHDGGTKALAAVRTGARRH